MCRGLLVQYLAETFPVDSQEMKRFQRNHGGISMAARFQQSRLTEHFARAKHRHDYALLGSIQNRNLRLSAFDNGASITDVPFQHHGRTGGLMLFPAVVSQTLQGLCRKFRKGLQTADQRLPPPQRDRVAGRMVSRESRIQTCLRGAGRNPASQYRTALYDTALMLPVFMLLLSVFMRNEPDLE